MTVFLLVLAAVAALVLGAAVWADRILAHLAPCCRHHCTSGRHRADQPAYTVTTHTQPDRHYPTWSRT